MAEALQRAGDNTSDPARRAHHDEGLVSDILCHIGLLGFVLGDPACPGVLDSRRSHSPFDRPVAVPIWSRDYSGSCRGYSSCMATMPDVRVP